MWGTKEEKEEKDQDQGNDSSGAAPKISLFKLFRPAQQGRARQDRGGPRGIVCWIVEHRNSLPWFSISRGRANTLQARPAFE